MNNFLLANKKWWNTVTPIHADSKLYDLKNFKKGRTSLQSIELKELGNVQDKSLLHLMCHFGLDTLSWARKGAHVTGVDISDQSIKLAQKLSGETKTPAEFICADINNLKSLLKKKYDIIFLSYGVLIWISDIKKFAKLINHYLKKDGTFYIVELHPFTNMLTSDFKIEYKYFDKGPDIDDSAGTYADWDAKIKGKTYLWNYTLGDLINSIINEGLKIEFLHEFPFTMYNQFPGLMRKNTKNQYVFKDKNINIPLLFSLKATK